MRTGTLAALVAAAGVTLFAGLQVVGLQVLDAQGARSYTWYAELLSVDQTARSITVKVQIRDGVTRYVGSYKPGEKLMLTWTPIKGESDTVIYAPKLEVMKGIDEGYILPVEFVAADPQNHALTVRVAAPQAVLQSVQSVQSGRWIKVVTPMLQKTDSAALTSAAAAEKPDLKPPSPPAPADTGRGRGRGQATPAAAAPSTAGGAAGTWTVSAQIAGNPVDSECVFAVEGAKLTGTCSGQQASGDVAGTNVKFQYSVSYNGTPLDFVYTGSIDPATNTMKGTVTVFGMTAAFSAVRK